MKSRITLIVLLAVALTGWTGCRKQNRVANESAEQDQSTEQGNSVPTADKPADNPKDTADRPGRAATLQLSTRLPDVVDKALPAVVGISTRKVVEMRRRPSPFDDHPFFRGLPFDRPNQRQQPRRERQGMGSGVIVSADGLIITNYHVIEGADDIQVSLSNGREELSAEIVGTDPATDIAIIKLKNPPSDLKPLAFGDSDGIRLGEPVVAIGNPFGLSGSVTYGIVSAKGRANVGLAEYEDFIQTDAAINPGNSGGALVNMEGELIGINTAILSRSGGYQGIGFAVPSKMAKSVMEKLVETGEVQRGWLGVVIQTLSPELAQGFDLPEGTSGVVISSVKKGGPADEAGLQQGDVITKLRGDKVESANDLRNSIARQSPGSTVEVTVLRDGETRRLEVKLGSLNEARGGTVEFQEKGVLQGLVLGPVNQEARQKYRLPDRLDQGIVVLDVKAGSPAARTGLRPGDVILEANRRALESVDQFAEAYESADRRLLLLIYRDGNTVFTAIPKVE